MSSWEAMPIMLALAKNDDAESFGFLDRILRKGS